MRIFYFILFAASALSAQTFQSMIERLDRTPVDRRQQIVEQYLNARRFSPIIEHDTLLHFVLYGEADSVFVNGNLQAWNEPERLTKVVCGRYSLFYKTFVVPSDSRLDYQLIINGKYQLDPQNPFITPSGYGPHSEVRMPKFVSSPYLNFRKDIPRGVIDSLAPVMNIPSPLSRYLPATRSIKVYRPAGYDTLSNLPVVYVHDGFEAIEYAYLPTVIDNLIADGKIPPIIAVFVPPVEREMEYIWMKREKFVNYLSEHLVPLIDDLYTTARTPEKRAVMGISNGGHISLYTALKRPDIFRNVGGQSSTITPALQDLTKKYAASSAAPGMKLYLDCGRYDIKGENREYGKFSFIDLNRKYSDLLASLHIPHYFKELNDGHEWANWRERMPEMLIYFFGTHQ